jgi:hypothetical protein
VWRRFVVSAVMVDVSELSWATTSDDVTVVNRIDDALVSYCGCYGSIDV